MNKIRKNDINEFKLKLFNALKHYYYTFDADLGRTCFIKKTDSFGFSMKFTVSGCLNKSDAEKELSKVVADNNLCNEWSDVSVKSCCKFRFKNKNLELKYGDYYTVMKIVVKSKDTDGWRRDYPLKNDE